MQHSVSTLTLTGDRPPNRTARRRACLATTIAALLASCAEHATLPVSAGTGPSPHLPSPVRSWLPTVDIAPAIGWQPGETPSPAPGLHVAAFASGLDHPRWLHVLPNGDVLVAETNAPPRPADGQGLRGWVMGLVMKRAGAATPSADRITLLRDTDGDGTADQRFVLVAHLNSPFGMALIGDGLYVANTDAVLRFPYTTGDTHVAGRGVELLALPAGPINHHWTKNLIASGDGTALYVTIGSNSNVGERGLAEEAGRAAIWEVDVRTGAHRDFATGLRNPNGLAWSPVDGHLWVVVNERDELGSDLVPDYLTSVNQGDFFGWPFSYYGTHLDGRAPSPAPGQPAVGRSPDYALGPHTASLGLAAATGDVLGSDFRNGMFVGQHGSWNRRPPSGYRVVFVPFAAGLPAGSPRVVLDGFLDAKGRARGRPVGVAVDTAGGLLVADDVGNTIWRVTAAP